MAGKFCVLVRDRCDTDVAFFCCGVKCFFVGLLYDFLFCFFVVYCNYFCLLCLFLFLFLLLATAADWFGLFCFDLLYFALLYFALLYFTVFYIVLLYFTLLCFTLLRFALLYRVLEILKS